MESIVAKQQKLKKHSGKVTPTFSDGNQQADKLPSSYAAAMQIHAGPIPSPQVLKGYEEICPGAAAQIIEMAHKQMDHRMSIEKDKLKKDFSLAARGQWFGFIVAIVGIASATWLGIKGYQVSAGILGGGSIGMIVLGFLGAKLSKKTKE